VHIAPKNARVPRKDHKRRSEDKEQAPSAPIHNEWERERGKIMTLELTFRGTTESGSLVVIINIQLSMGGQSIVKGASAAFAIRRGRLNLQVGYTVKRSVAFKEGRGFIEGAGWSERGDKGHLRRILGFQKWRVDT